MPRIGEYAWAKATMSIITALPPLMEVGNADYVGEACHYRHPYAQTLEGIQPHCVHEHSVALPANLVEEAEKVGSNPQ